MSLFQSTRLREARHGPRTSRSATTSCFNPRACVRRDGDHQRSARFASLFQSTRLRKARHPISHTSQQPSLPFQSTRLRKARPAASWTSSSETRFNPRACVRRDIKEVPGPERIVEFQSTRLRKARRAKSCRTRRRSRCFNPRACVRRDGCVQSTNPRQKCFNPRACVRRDYPRCCGGGPPACFNPRACVRRDTTISPCRMVSSWFQSTRLRKARQSHHNSLRDKDFFYEIREPVPPLDSKDAGRGGTM